jgi:hypothetical protein
MTIQIDNLNSSISAVGADTNIPVNIQPKGTGGLNLLGSGQNLQLQSQTFTNATTWQPQNATTPTGNTTTAPDGTSTGSTFAESITTTFQAVLESTSPVFSGITYTYSIYAKANTATVIQLLGRTTPFGANIWANYNLSNGTVGSTGTSNVSATIVSVGNGWFRCSLTGVAIGAGTGSFAFCLVQNNASATRFPSYLGTGQTVFVWGAQFEIGSVANTYVPTTTTAIYGTPALTLSGVAGIGLESNGALYVSPAGTGALQAQATTSSTVGGNARGANAVDWQTYRTGATQVASGSYSVVSGGSRNTASGVNTTIGGGDNNSSNSVGAFIGGGYLHAITNSSQTYSAIVGGYNNSANGVLNFIGGGQLNSATAAAAVTTQATTTVTSGSTAVTLSGSNANIKVGQLITGTGIVTFTYVAAISGTSLTLSQNANATGTPTLSFFTPHGVVVGGGNNQATGSYSFIGGGGDAGTAANRNVASGDWSFIGGGGKNTASGIGSVICGGGNFGSGFSANTSSGTSAFIGAGYNNISAGFAGSILGGVNNLQNGNFSSVLGGASGTTRAIVANFVFPSGNPLNSTGGLTQAALIVLAKQTTDATPTVLTSDTGVGGTTNQVILPNNSAYFFRGEVVSGVTGGGNTKGWTIEGVIKRGANAASTTLVGVTVMSPFADVGAAAWTIAVTADTTNGGLAVTFTGQAGTTIRTVAQIRTTEMTF